MNTKKAVIITAIVTFFATSALAVGAWSVYNSGALSMLGIGINGSYSASSVLRAEKIIKSSYYKDVDDATLYKGALQGMMASLNDQYSWFVDEGSYKELTQDLGGKYTGIGVNVTLDTEDELITVVSPIEDTPAFKAGIAAGDKIISVNGTPVSKSNYQDAISMMRGSGNDVGDEIKLTIRRAATGTDEEMTLKREEITLKTVKYKMLDDKVGYIRITSFDENTGDEFTSALTELSGMKGLVIDLRNNGGGMLEPTLKIADSLLPEGLITYFEYRNGEKTEYKSDADYLDIPLAVLINGSSASASEVLSGAIRDHSRGTLIGEKSFGKGIVQSILPFMKTKNGETAIYITTSRYFTPSGECIHGQGISPDIQVPMPEEYASMSFDELTLDQDAQLEAAYTNVLSKIQ